MPLLHHDTTGTQTDCPKPLSRKKLKQLMPQNRGLRTATLKETIGRRIGLNVFSAMFRKRQERSAKRKLHTKRTLSDGTTFQLIPNAADIAAMKPTIFERMAGMFGLLRRKTERAQQRG